LTTTENREEKPHNLISIGFKPFCLRNKEAGPETLQGRATGIVTVTGCLSLKTITK